MWDKIVSQSVFVLLSSKWKPLHGAAMLFVISEVKHCSIHFLVFLDCFGNWLHHRGILSIILSAHDRFLQSSASHLSHHGKSYIFIHCCLFLFFLSFFLFFLFKDYSCSHSLCAISFLCHHGACHTGRYLVAMASVCLSVCPCLQTHCCQHSKWREMCDRISVLSIA